MFLGKTIWGGKMYDFRRITLFCLVYRLSQRKMTICSKNFGGRHGHKIFRPSGKCAGDSLKNLSPYQKTLCPPWYPKLITGLAVAPPTLHAILYVL